MDIIKSSSEITSLFNNGRRIYTPYITLIVLNSECGRTVTPSGRVAFVAGKKNGNAVWRNAAKRRMRAIYQQLPLDQFCGNIVFVAKRSILTASFQEVLLSVEKVLPKIRKE